MAYVQGARPPGHPAARHLAQQLFERGNHCTSGFRCSGTYHGCGPVPPGAATDWGDSVNDLQGQWRVLFPHRARMEELLGPWGLYKRGSRFYHSSLQAAHRDHNHVANTSYVWLSTPVTPVRLMEDEALWIHQLKVWRKLERAKVGTLAERRRRRRLMRKHKWEIRKRRKYLKEVGLTDRFDRKRRFNVLGTAYRGG